MQHNLIKHIFSDIVHCAVGYALFVSDTGEYIFFHAVQIHPFHTVATKKIYGIFIVFAMLVRLSAAFVGFLRFCDPLCLRGYL